ncbi:hypothetical protein RA28_09940 [Ruegeria sp. ANG-S4]|uniref:Hpt domain-containing protein n=1 Tax=Ruegeria sp. ANG-S4 TaxID=1577904 RepID=UPI000580B26C|nr:Hpt domain-containing protein [Ruegeria sp. ANG-S4]KIC45961.1 hypothetical protein RA28_09940 [Ruegeria sp. ANG-S4]
MANEDQLNTAIALLRSRFVDTCGDRLKTLAQAVDAIRIGADATQELSQIRRECHKLAGLAGSIGFSELGELAEEIDITLKTGQSDWAAVEPKLGELMQALANLKK